MSQASAKPTEKRISSIPGTSFPELPVSVPLVLDLDGTLLRSDLLLESFVFSVKRSPFVLFRALKWLVTGGRAHLKEQLALREAVDCEGIPTNEEVVALARREFAYGREVVLATAANEVLAHRVAKRFDFISTVLASNGLINLKGRQKASVLKDQFPQGFIYAGDSSADMHVWKEAAGCVIVSESSKVRQKVEALPKPSVTVPLRVARFKDLAKAIRIQQCVKNVLIFAPLFLAGKFTEPAAWGAALLAFLGMSLAAASTYLLNDLLDLADDRRHWSKRNRALASGVLPIRTALISIPALFASGIMIASVSGTGVMALTLLYAAISLSYSFKLKRVPIVDVMIIAGLFSLRLLIGVVAVNAAFSTWLFVFSTALFLSIALAKRHTEVLRMKQNNREHASGRGYRAADEPLVLSLGTGSAVAAIVFFSLYLMSDSVRHTFYPGPQFLWVACCGIFLWLGRIWLLSQRGELNDDPVAFAVKDRPSILLGVSVAASFVLATFVQVPL